MSKHTKFIMTPIRNVIEEMNTATSGLKTGIEIYPLWDYILQATFTKMTGFQEQKIKCIDWELATNGYEYRISFVNNIKNKGTYSTYKVKNSVYNVLINEIIRYTGEEKQDFIKKMKREVNIDPEIIVKKILDTSNVVHCKNREFEDFKQSTKEFKGKYFCVSSEKDKQAQLLADSLKAHYEKELYRQRNRIAHNTISYQQNLPNLDILKSKTDYSRNYFFWFSILVLIDEIFIELYKIYTKCLQDNSYFEE